MIHVAAMLDIESHHHIGKTKKKDVHVCSHCGVHFHCLKNGYFISDLKMMRVYKVFANENKRENFDLKILKFT